MFKCFFLPSFFFVFAVVNFGVSGFDDSTRGANMTQKLCGKNQNENIKKNKNSNSKTRLDTKNHKKNMNINSPRVAKSLMDEHIKKNQLGNKENLVEQQGDDFKQLVLYYYIAVSFLLYAYKKVDFTDSFSELGDKPYKGPVDEDVFAVYKEFSGSDSKGMSTYDDYLSHFCKDALKEFLGVKEKISYSDAYGNLCDKIKKFLSQVEEIDIKLEKDKWQDESVQWAFTVALQVFAYKKIYEHLNENISSLEGNNKDAALQHDLVYVKFLSEMMHNIFKNVLESFSLDAVNIIRSRNLFFLSGLKPKNIGPESPKNMFYSAFSNLVFRPARLDGSVRTFLDCFYPIIDRMKRIK